METIRTTERQFCRCYCWLYPAGAAIFDLGILSGVPSAEADTDILNLIFQGVRIIQLSNLSDEQESELGQQINQQILADGRVYDNSSITQYVDSIGQQLVRGTERSQISHIFQVIEDDQVNAFATLGGFVYLNTRLLRTADNETQLASVIAHEVAHIDRRHALQQLQQAAISQGLPPAGGLEQRAAIALGVELALLPADSAPIATGDCPQKLLEPSNATPDFLSTHSHPEDRLNALNKRLDPQLHQRERG